MPDLYALDTNVYIGAQSDAEAGALLRRFLKRRATRTRLAATVALELRAGAHTAEQRSAVQALVESYAQRDWQITPSFEAMLEAGRVLSELTGSAGERRGGVAASFTNDVLLAATCREAGVVLVTNNAHDFGAIKRHLRGFRYAMPASALR